MLCHISIFGASAGLNELHGMFPDALSSFHHKKQTKIENIFLGEWDECQHLTQTNKHT
jgi:hypothetical protein